MEHPPRFPERLPGSLWGVAAYFNPLEYRTRREHFRAFRDRSRDQGLRLVVVECALPDADFDLSEDDADIMVRCRSDAVLWQKERLLNIGFSHLPGDCDKVVWMDADILLMDDHWMDSVSALLEQYMVVQPFRRLFQVPRGIPLDDARSPAPSWVVSEGAASLYASADPGTFQMAGRPGFAMAARRSLVRDAGLYDRMIVGGGDSLFFGACLGMRIEENLFLRHGNHESLVADSSTWVSRVFAAVRGSVFFHDQDCLHGWHGDPPNRFYAERRQLLRNVDCMKDIVHAPDGPWRFAVHRPDIQRDLRAYFLLRDEDGQGTAQHAEAEELRRKLATGTL